jgi:NADH-quinone oxidoreductase subunit J
MESQASLVQWFLGALLILSAIGVVALRKPIYASLSFLLSLLVIAAFFLQLHAEFLAVMQILIYAGAILVIFIFVIVLFQDAHQQIERYEPKSQPQFLLISAIAFVVTLLFFGAQLIHLPNFQRSLPEGFGQAQGIGQALYLDFFFPFEAVILLFLVAIVGALYIAKREKR